MFRPRAMPDRDVGEAADAILADDGSPQDGPDDATLRLAVFSDYRCPACRRAFPELEEALARDGGVRVVHKDWPIFGAPSERAARIAIAAAQQGLYPAVHRRLMTDARAIDEAMLRDTVTAAGGDWQQATRWLADHDDIVSARLQRNGRQALSIGLTGTPGYLAGRLAVLGAIEAGDFLDLFARARDARRPATPLP